jgi:hypothetical protein
MSDPVDPINPGPQWIPNEQVSMHEPPGSLESIGRSDRDNFVRNRVTILTGPPQPASADGGPGGSCSDMVVPISPSARDLTPLVTLDEIKLWLRIEPSQTIEDSLLQMLEMAAHLHTENYLRQILDGSASIGENIKTAQLLLIAHWYRNREALTTTGVGGEGTLLPLGYAALLSPQRDYPCIY